jgi:hypothetical protein
VEIAQGVLDAAQERAEAAIKGKPAVTGAIKLTLSWSAPFGVGS